MLAAVMLAEELLGLLLALPSAQVLAVPSVEVLMVPSAEVLASASEVEALGRVDKQKVQELVQA